MKKSAALTICSINYLPKAFALIDSYLEFHPEDDFYLLVVDKKAIEINFPQRRQLKIIWVEELGIEGIYKYAFMYDVIEFNTNVKPYALAKILPDYQSVIYLDPDIKVYSSLKSVRDALFNSSVVVTPHYNTPIIDGNKPDDVELLKFGAFNLGFVGVANSEEGCAFLKWWSDRCLRLGFYEPQSGLGVDQKWINLAPCFFENFKILHDEGLNVAFWNLHERSLTLTENVWHVNNHIILKFVHFSSFDFNAPEAIAQKQTRFKVGDRPDFVELAKKYAEEVASNEDELGKISSYGFDYFENGKYIAPALRRIYARLHEKLFVADENPFASNGVVYCFAKKNKLLVNELSRSKRHTFKDLHAYGLQIKIINLALRMALRIIGPEKYFNLMRYMAHVSSIRNQQIFDNYSIK